MRSAYRDGTLFALILLLLASGAMAHSPPPQPATGPGGSDYAHGRMTSSGPYWAEGRTTQDQFRYFIYEPAEPRPTTAPVVLFLHGWLAVDPEAYLGWIEHIVRKGYIVVWAQYQLLVSLPRSFADNATRTWKDALGRLEDGTHVTPAKDRFRRVKSAFVGHSFGAYLSAILAARAANPLNGMTNPHAVVSIEPGGLNIIPADSFSPIPATTKMVVVVADEDDVVCKATGVAIWTDTAQILAANRDFLFVRSDRHGSPAQISNHYFPNTTGFRDTKAVDARDFYVTFKLSVAALNCAFDATDCSYALGKGTPEQVDMGIWSDGVPVLPMVSVRDPLALQTICRDPAF